MRSGPVPGSFRSPIRRSALRPHWQAKALSEILLSPPGTFARTPGPGGVLHRRSTSRQIPRLKNRSHRGICSIFSTDSCLEMRSLWKSVPRRRETWMPILRPMSRDPSTRCPMGCWDSVCQRQWDCSLRVHHGGWCVRLATDRSSIRSRRSGPRFSTKCR